MLRKELIIYLAALLCLSLFAEAGKKNKAPKPLKPIPRPRDYDYYDTEYPRYLYKPYPSNCSSGYYDQYRRYLRRFKEQWYDRERYPAYNLTRKQSEQWDRYGRYEYRGTYPTGTNKPGKKGACCYEFKKSLPKRTLDPDFPKNRVRREYRTLSDAERNDFHDALKSLKDFGGYDTFVGYHRDSVSPHAHGGASFLPWHREFLFRLENALTEHGWSGGLPYFDSSLDELLPDPSSSAIWSSSYMGNLGGPVISGPGAFWSSILGCGPPLYRVGIRGWQGKCNLFNDFDINYVYSKRCFRDITCNTDCKFEADHAGVHNFVGGQMSNPSCAPSDPIFFLHHAFVDCIWEEFRQNHQESTITKEYPSLINGDDTGSPPPAFSLPNGFEWFKEMSPVTPVNPISAFPGILNGHGIDNFYQQYYKCAPRPHGCKHHSDCKSKVLWCNNGRCTAKVRLGGFCGTLPDVACAGPCSFGWVPDCANGVCVCRTLTVKADIKEVPIEAIKKSAK